MKKTNNLLFSVLIILWLFLNLAGGILIKYSGIYHENWLLLGVLFVFLIGTWGGRAVVSMLIGQKFQLSYAYPFLGMNYVLSIIAGILLFGEKFILQRLIGSLIIVDGITVLMLSKNKTENKEV